MLNQPRGNEKTKTLFNQAAEKMGLISSELLNIFVTGVVREQALPFSLKVVPDKSNALDEESKKVMIKELAIVKGLIPDDDNKVNDLNSYLFMTWISSNKWYTGGVTKIKYP